jgi:hypothetical protein
MRISAVLEASFVSENTVLCVCLYQIFTVRRRDVTQDLTPAVAVTLSHTLSR